MNLHKCTTWVYGVSSYSYFYEGLAFPTLDSI